MSEKWKQYAPSQEQVNCCKCGAMGLSCKGWGGHAKLCFRAQGWVQTSSEKYMCCPQCRWDAEAEGFVNSRCAQEERDDIETSCWCERVDGEYVNHVSEVCE